MNDPSMRRTCSDCGEVYGCKREGGQEMTCDDDCPITKSFCSVRFNFHLPETSGFCKYHFERRMKNAKGDDSQEVS